MPRDRSRRSRSSPRRRSRSHHNLSHDRRTRGRSGVRNLVVKDGRSRRSRSSSRRRSHSHHNRPARTLPCDLSEKFVKDLLSDHVQMANCKPKVLFCLNQITKQGTSSEWGTMSKYLNLLLGTARATDGRIPRQYDFHKSFRSGCRTSTWIGPLGIPTDASEIFVSCS